MVMIIVVLLQKANAILINIAISVMPIRIPTAYANLHNGYCLSCTKWPWRSWLLQLCFINAIQYIKSDILGVVTSVGFSKSQIWSTIKLHWELGPTYHYNTRILFGGSSNWKGMTCILLIFVHEFIRMSILQLCL